MRLAAGTGSRLGGKDMEDLIETGYRIGHHTIRPLEGSIDGPGGLVHVEPRIIDVLNVFARHPDEVISRERLHREVWPDSYVSESCLYHNVSVLRKLLGDDGQNPSILKTVPKRGYRLVAPVAPLRGAARPAMPCGSKRVPARLAAVLSGPPLRLPHLARALALPVIMITIFIAAAIV